MPGLLIVCLVSLKVNHCCMAIMLHENFFNANIFIFFSLFMPNLTLDSKHFSLILVVF